MSSSDLIGFVVSGFFGAEPTPTNARTIPVLAHDDQEAIKTAVASNAGFNPSGIMSEQQLQQQLDEIQALRAATRRK